MRNITPVILAAGGSTRMGYPKALLPLGEDTFLTRILRTLSTFDLADTRVVLGDDAERILRVIPPHSVRVLVNPDPSRGQFSSLRLALESLEGDIAGCLVWPVDQPLISAGLVHSLIRLFLRSDCSLAMPRCGGKAGHPALFGAALIHELLAAPADSDAKSYVARHASDTAWLMTDETGTILDIDTPEEYRRGTGEAFPVNPTANRCEGPAGERPKG